MFDVIRDTSLLLVLTAIVPRCTSDVGCRQDLSDTSAMKRFRDSCYQFVSQEKFWFEARDYCRTNGGRLVKIDDAETNDFIVRSLNDLWWRNNGVWIGLHDLHRELHFQWAGVNPFENDALGSWTNWGRGHPGAFLHSFRDCVRMVRENGRWKWHETVCSAMKWHYRFICQYRAQAHAIGVQSSLTQNIPAPRQQDNSPSPTTTRTTAAITTAAITTEATTSSELLSAEDIDYLFACFQGLDGDNQPFDGSFLPDGQNQEKFDEETTMVTATEINEQTVDEKILVELENFYESPELAEIKSQPIAMEYDNNLGSKGLTLIIVLCSIFALSLIVAAILLIRRRRSVKTLESVEESNDVITVDKKSDKKEPPTVIASTNVVSNIYVTDDDIRNDVKRRAAHDAAAADDDDVTGNYDSLTSSVDDGNEARREGDPELTTDDCGMMGYDMPRPTNVYDEIPELVPCAADGEDHEYESLDDVIARVTLDDVIAATAV